ncbi:MAG: hypothetical protein QGG60_05730 [Anaerolineales bacterium]|nr:hypothetical protein [Anaerolineales bacterium]MDP7644188.1 hypothetical protein [Anaerolineales bacterium]HJN41412.1 hypothetical protein [Anaerolineales bacterium]
MQTETPASASERGAQLTSHESELASALAGFRANPRVARITIAISPDACATGRDIQGTYPKEQTPRIPLETCSRTGGCTCRYLPVLNEIFP